MSKMFLSYKKLNKALKKRLTKTLSKKKTKKLLKKNFWYQHYNVDSLENLLIRLEKRLLWERDPADFWNFDNTFAKNIVEAMNFYATKTVGYKEEYAYKTDIWDFKEINRSESINLWEEHALSIQREICLTIKKPFNEYLNQDKIIPFPKIKSKLKFKKIKGSKYSELVDNKTEEEKEAMQKYFKDIEAFYIKNKKEREKALILFNHYFEGFWD